MKKEEIRNIFKSFYNKIKKVKIRLFGKESKMLYGDFIDYATGAMFTEGDALNDVRGFNLERELDESHHFTDKISEEALKIILNYCRIRSEENLSINKDDPFLFS